MTPYALSFSPPLSTPWIQEFTIPMPYAVDQALQHGFERIAVQLRSTIGRTYPGNSAWQSTT